MTHSTISDTFRICAAALAMLLLACAAAHRAHAQTDPIANPPELYCGENYIRISPPSGVRRVRIISASDNLTVFGAGRYECDRLLDLRVNVSDPGPGALKLEITDCNNRTFMRDFATRNWNIDVNNLGEIQLGDTACYEFQIRANPATGTAESVFLDSITVNDARVSLKLPGRMPVKINPGQTYRYTVCFASNQLGRFKFPSITWIRRKYPTGNLTTYAVADTGLVTVVRRREPVIERPIHRTPDTPLIAEPAVTDPTTFRSIAVPNAVIPEPGRFYVGSYDVLGLTAGYAVNDNFMIIGGGALPTPDDWGGMKGDIFGAYSIGAKAGLRLADKFDVAAGFQWGRSFYDKQNPPADTVRSDITVSVPYAALSYGDDDSRISVTAGYAFKHHTKPHVEFDQNAAIVAFGADHRIGRNWKIAGELLSMETVGVVPIIATVRYFTDRFAVDAGAAYLGITTGDAAPPRISVAPVVSAIFVF